jgi:hypothetical protein
MRNCFLVTIGLAICEFASAQTVPNLINYQGRLTDQTGAPLSPGAYSIQFRLWDTPTGSNVLLWAQQQNVTVQSNGVFNVILGAPGGGTIQGAAPLVNDLTLAFTNSNRFLGVTVVVSNGIQAVSLSEILPRQKILSVPFAVQAQNAQLATTVVPGSITTASLTPGLIQGTNIAEGAITWAKLALRQTLTNSVGVGGIAVTASTNLVTSSFSFVDAQGLSVTIDTMGRPVVVMLVSDPASSGNLRTGIGGFANATISMTVGVVADGTRPVGFSDLQQQGSYTQAPNYMVIPASAIQFIDFSASPGPHTYRVRVKNNGFSNVFTGEARLDNVRLVAYEL